MALRTVHENRPPTDGACLLRNLFARRSRPQGRWHHHFERRAAHRFHTGPHDAALLQYQRDVRWSGQTDIGLKILYDNPNRADRSSTGCGALTGSGGPCVIVDMGTTINFQLRLRDENFGGIAVGIGISINACFQPDCPPAESGGFQQPENVIGTNTVASMQSGLYFGAIGMIDGILERAVDELGSSTKAIATAARPT